MDKTLNQIIISLLKTKSNEYLTARDIAEFIWENETDFCNKKMKNTTKKGKDELISQIIAEVGSRYPRGLNNVISRTADRPHKYYYDNKSETVSSCTKRKNNQVEQMLYSKLAIYCESLGIKTLRIDEKTSKKNGGKNHNIWLHADVVGYQDLTTKFIDETKELLIQSTSERSYLYAFEVKDGIIKTSDLRESFFQTVSNSSWANYSYLVAEGIEDKAKEELQLLCSSFKIGFIQLNRDYPIDSDIVIQAPKTDLDWRMINRIAEENTDFREYLKNISLSYKKHSNTDIKTPTWDIDKIR